MEYRRSLVSSFFFKFYLNVSLQLSNHEVSLKCDYNHDLYTNIPYIVTNDRVFLYILQQAHGTDVPKSFLSGASHFQRDITSSTQTFQVLRKF